MRSFTRYLLVVHLVLVQSAASGLLSKEQQQEVTQGEASLRGGGIVAVDSTNQSRFLDTTNNDHWTTITFDDFEADWGNFAEVPGSRDTNRLKRNSCSASGLYTLHLRDSSGDRSSVFLAHDQALTDFSNVRVSFYYKTIGMAGTETFFLEYSPDSGITWVVIKEFGTNIKFLSNQCVFVDSVDFRSILGDNLILNDWGRIRFRNNGNDNSDKLFIDDVHFEGFVAPGPSLLPHPSPTQATITTDPEEIILPHPPPTQPTPTTDPGKIIPPSPIRAPTSTPPRINTDDFCPKHREYPPETFEVAKFMDIRPSDGIDDDLNEVSSLAYSFQKDSEGNRYAYMFSDKKQMTLKVVKLFQESPEQEGGYFPHGHGDTVAIYTIFTPSTIPVLGDWEDLSLGPCTDVDGPKYTTEQVCIYVGDFGNNNEPKRDELSIYKFVEPTIDPMTGPVSQTIKFATIKYSYGDGFRQDLFFDTETIFVDWTGTTTLHNDDAPGDLYVITKSGCRGGVGRIAVSSHRHVGPGESTSLSITRYSEIPSQGDESCSSAHFQAWSGGDMRQDGRLIAMIRQGAPSAVYFFARGADQTIASALDTGQCDYIAAMAVGLKDETRHEGVAFVGTEGLEFAEISECQGDCADNGGPKLRQHTLLYSKDILDPPVRIIPTKGWSVILSDDFEDGRFGSFQQGGSNAVVASDSEISSNNNNCGGRCACEGDFAVQLSEDRGIASSIFTASSRACTTFDLLRVSFAFKFRGFDHLDTLFLEVSFDGGEHHLVVGDWSKDVLESSLREVLQGATCYQRSVLLTRSQFGVSSFGNEVKLRFRNSGNSGNDRVYLDQITWEGHLDSAL